MDAGVVPGATERTISRMAPRTSVDAPGSLVQVVVPESRPDLNPDAARVLARIIQRAAASARQDDPTDD